MNIFEEILSRETSEIERPKPLPAGTYRVAVRGLPEFGESSRKKTPYARYVLEVLEAGPDVDKEALESCGGLENKTLRHELYLTQDALWRAKEFVENCGVDTDGMTIGQALESVNGCQLLVGIRQEPAVDGGDGLFARIMKTAPVA